VFYAAAFVAAAAFLSVVPSEHAWWGPCTEL
jgi:hypothetical protein